MKKKEGVGAGSAHTNNCILDTLSWESGYYFKNVKSWSSGIVPYCQTHQLASVN